jgi:hypothetical protein
MEDVARIDTALEAHHAPSTLDSYGSAWRGFERWCHERGFTPLPAAPEVVCAYITRQAERGLTMGTAYAAAKPACSGVKAADDEYPVSGRSTEANPASRLCACTSAESSRQPARPSLWSAPITRSLPSSWCES